MAEVYSPTTVPNPKTSWFIVPSQHLDKTRFGVKVCEVLLSLVAFVLEELVDICLSCPTLYFFEFVSCMAFLFTLLLLILLATALYTKVGITCWPCLDFVYTVSVAFFFSISSIVFSVDNNKTTLEISAVVFGFMASIFFIADIIMFLRSYGFPFKKDGRAESSNGVLGVEAPLPEKELLNIPTNTAE